jgi:hypothetical protein
VASAGGYFAIVEYLLSAGANALLRDKVQVTNDAFLYFAINVAMLA